MSVESGRPPSALRVTIWFWGTGGAGIRLADRAAAAASASLPPGNVTVFGHADNPLLPQAAERGNRVIAIAGAAGHGRVGALAAEALPRAVRFWHHLRDDKPDAVVIPMNFALAWPLADLLRLLRIPYAYTVHDAAPHPGDFAPLWQIGTQRRLVAGARCVIAPSTSTADQVRTRLSPKAPIEVIPLAAQIPARAVVSRRTPTAPIRLLFLGRLLPYKGLSLLAEALRPLGHRPDWRLTVAGTGPEAERVRRSFSRLDQVDLSDLRALPEEAVDALIEAHDVMICPYTEASQSGVVAEALAQAMPCLVTPVGALPEQVDGGRLGWVTAGPNPDDLRMTIAAILDHPEQIAAKSREAAAQAAQRSPGVPMARVLRILAASGGRQTGTPPG